MAALKNLGAGTTVMAAARASMLAARVAVILAMGMAFHACSSGDKLAGGYDDVENPALTLSLLDRAGTAYGPGQVRIFARYQNPVADSLAVISLPASAEGMAEIPAHDIIAAMRLAQSRGISWPNADSIEFNVLTSTLR